MKNKKQKKDAGVQKELSKQTKALVKELKKQGFTVQRYDAYSTNSIYLKLDFGVCNSIRISNHNGKGHLSYRYNLLTCCPYPLKSKNKKGFYRYYYPMEETDQLMKQILADRFKKMNRYGKRNYESYMTQNKEQGKNKKGFWQQAKIV